MKIKTVKEFAHDENCYMPLYNIVSRPLVNTKFTHKRSLKMYNTADSVRFCQSMELYERTGFIVLLPEPDWYEGYEPEGYNDDDNDFWWKCWEHDEEGFRW